MPIFPLYSFLARQKREERDNQQTRAVRDKSKGQERTHFHLLGSVKGCNWLSGLIQRGRRRGCRVTAPGASFSCLQSEPWHGPGLTGEKNEK